MTPDIPLDLPLRAGWKRVRANRGAPGGDGVTIEAFERNLEVELADLAREIGAGRYRPGRLRRVDISKPSGGTRRLRIPCVRDRVVQSAVLFLLTPELDRRQSDRSHAYRPLRSVAAALDMVRRVHAAGLRWTAEADIARCFDRIPHARLLQELTIWIDSPAILGLIRLWLRGFASFGYGIAQGAPISPLLANLYLHPLDRMLEGEGCVPVRYADDFVILAPSEGSARQGLDTARGILRSRGLRLRPAKTRLVPPGEAFAFLGETLCAPAEG